MRNFTAILVLAISLTILLLMMFSKAHAYRCEDEIGCRSYKEHRQEVRDYWDRSKEQSYRGQMLRYEKERLDLERQRQPSTWDEVFEKYRE